jgi:hypothetical protein
MLAQVILTLAPSAVRTATLTTPDIGTLLNPQLSVGVANSPQPPVSCSVFIAYLNITAVPGVDTVLLKLQELEPVSQTWLDVAGAATLAQVATGLVKLEVGLSLATVAATAALARLQSSVPPNFRFVVVPSAASNFTYSLAVAVTIGA